MSRRSEKRAAANARLTPAVLAVALLLVLALTVVGSTRLTKTASGMRFYENTRFKFMIAVVPNKWVDPTGQRFWIATWRGSEKCIAGINVPVAGRQFTFNVLRWSWPPLKV